MTKSELNALSPKFIMEKGVERYINYDNKGALYYYNSIIELYGENESAQEYVAWAHYEVGFINYMENRKPEAVASLQKVLQTLSPSKAPHVLAAKLLKKIESEQKKNEPPAVVTNSSAPLTNTPAN
ncbi:MAG: hypothetical protein A2Y33_10565 [Spirochaetes bacterium GWF1_51_8]|nr:MAG: hypothetical protein A2Y33_10565 [Spirochaetes bacterium GWF1_51_8]